MKVSRAGALWRRSSVARRVATVAAALVTGLGAAVMAAWHLHLPVVIQIGPPFETMKYNTALAFVALGVAMLGVLHSTRGWPAVLALVAGAIGGATLAEYMLGVDLGIDHRFVLPYVTVRTLHPGRMAPNTALALVITAVSLACAANLRDDIKRAPTLAFPAVIVIGLGASALIGYVGGLDEAYAWGQFTRMGLHTAVGFVAAGAGMIAEAWDESRRRAQSSSLWLSSLPIVVAGAVIVLLTWRALALQERLQVTRMIRSHGEASGEQIERALANARHDLEDYLSAFKGSDGSCVRALAHLKRTQRVVESLAVLAKDGRTLCRAGDVSDRAIAVARTVTPGSAEGGTLPVADDPSSLVLVVTPQGETSQGKVIAATITLPHLLAELPKGPDTYFNLCIALATGGVRCRTAASPPAPLQWQKVTVRPASMQLSVEVGPTSELISSAYSPLPAIVLVGGLLTTGLLGFAVYLAKSEQVHARALEEEVSIRTRAENRLRSLAFEVSRAEERERRRIATGLHDGAIQSLGLSRMKLSEYRADAPTDTSSTLLDDALTLIEGTIAETRSLLFELSPPVLYELGLPAGLSRLAENTARDGGFSCDFVDDGDEIPVDTETAVVLFQAVRELLQNVRKHADATNVTIRLQRDATAVSVLVEDDGRGFDADRNGRSQSAGFGLFNIRERIALLGGNIEIRTANGKGTAITLAVPTAMTGGISA